MSSAGQPLDQLCFVSPLVTIGRFLATPDDLRFRNSGPIEHALVVFPRSRVTIRHHGKPAFVSSPAAVNLYNAGQEFQRGAIDSDVDCSDWFAFPEELLGGALQDRGAVISGASGSSGTAGQAGDIVTHHLRPFIVTHTPCDARTVLSERRLLFRLLTSPPAPTTDPLAIEEAALRVLLAILDQVARRQPGRQPANRRRPTSSQRRAVSLVADLVAAEPLAARSLSELARTANMSPCHLSRSFRQLTGWTLTRYRDEVRLRLALDRLLDGAGGGVDDLTDLALDLGFASHSHFTERFRRTFGVPPSEVRRSGRRGSELRARSLHVG